jgi:hypothetical protein
MINKLKQIGPKYAVVPVKPRVLYFSNICVFCNKFEHDQSFELNTR